MHMRWAKLMDRAERAEAEVVRLIAAISRIDAINDNPARFIPEINEVCDEILRPSCNGKMDDGDTLQKTIIART